MFASSCFYVLFISNVITSVKNPEWKYQKFEIIKFLSFCAEVEKFEWIKQTQRERTSFTEQFLALLFMGCVLFTITATVDEGKHFDLHFALCFSFLILHDICMET